MRPVPSGGQSTDARPAPSYRAFCPVCKKAGRRLSSYGSAEHVAQGHADKYGHTTHVIDQYGIRVVGSDRTPGR